MSVDVRFGLEQKWCFVVFCYDGFFVGLFQLEND